MDFYLRMHCKMVTQVKYNSPTPDKSCQLNRSMQHHLIS